MFNAIGMSNLRHVCRFGCAACLLGHPIEISAQTMRHWDSDDFRKFVGMRFQNGLLQRRVTLARGLDE